MNTEARWEAVMASEDLPPARSREPRLMLSQPEAAAALSISQDSFVRHVAPEIRMVRRGTLRLAPIAELERWIEANSVCVRGQA